MKRNVKNGFWNIVLWVLKIIICIHPCLDSGTSMIKEYVWCAHVVAKHALDQGKINVSHASQGFFTSLVLVWKNRMQL